MTEEQQQPPVESAGRVIRHNNKEIPLWGWLAVIAYMVLVDNFMPSEYEGWAIVAGWFAAGAMCLVNYSSCGRYHCKITGLGFFGLGVLAVLEEIGVIDLEAWITWTTLLAVLAVGFGLEYRYKKSKSGSSYVVACGSKACSSSGGDEEFCMNNDDDDDDGDHARMYKYVPGSTLAASIITAVVLHYFFPVTTIIPFPYNLLGLLIVGFGVYSAFLSVRLLLSNNTTFEAGGNPSSLVTRRPYSYSRNPIYLGFLLIALGTSTILSSLSAFIAPIIFFLVVNTIIIPFEENRLQKNFGIEYEKYKASVRRWIQIIEKLGWLTSDSDIVGISCSDKGQQFKINTEMVETSSASAADEIIKYAKEKAIDLIVVGTKGRSGMTKALLGSIASKIVTYSPCLVLVVR